MNYSSYKMLDTYTGAFTFKACHERQLTKSLDGVGLIQLRTNRAVKLVHSLSVDGKINLTVKYFLIIF